MGAAGPQEDTMEAWRPVGGGFRLWILDWDFWKGPQLSKAKFDDGPEGQPLW
jgi:hypothetical protein